MSMQILRNNLAITIQDMVDDFYVGIYDSFIGQRYGFHLSPEQVEKLVYVLTMGCRAKDEVVQTVRGFIPSDCPPNLLPF